MKEHQGTQCIKLTITTTTTKTIQKIKIKKNKRREENILKQRTKTKQISCVMHNI